MKRYVPLWTLLLFSLPICAGAQTELLVASSRITAVTVYADRAQVTRSASVELKPGTNLIRFDALPLTLAEDSLRVEGKGTGKARIAGLTVKNVFLERLKEQKIRALEDEIRALTAKVEGIEARSKGLLAQASFIDSIKVGWSERVSKEIGMGKPTTAELSEASRFVGEGIGKVEEGLYRAEEEKRPLAEKIGALKKELEQSRGERHKEVRSVEVAIEASKAMRFDVELSYLVEQARWEPAYDVRLAADGTSAELTYRGMVWQKSGEDWPGVQLSLSTASPEMGGAPPELSPWHVQFYLPPPPARIMGGAYKSEMAFAPSPAPMALAKGSPVLMEPALPQSALATEGATSVLFNIVQPVDIPADGTRQGTTITLASLPVSAEYITVPKLSPLVYLKSEVKNSTPYPLLSGPANIFNDATFTGKESLKTVASTEKFDLFFGADHQLKVKRESERIRKEAGLLGKNRITYRVSVELENLKKKGVTVTLLDQLPLAANEEIKVSLEEARPHPDEVKPDGTLLWKVSLAPGEKKTIPYEILIEYPKGKEITGVQ